MNKPASSKTSSIVFPDGEKSWLPGIIYTGMFLSFNFLNVVTTVFKLSNLGKEVLNKSPEMRMKSTASCTHLSTALLKAKVLISFNFGSLQLPIWQSAM